MHRADSIYDDSPAERYHFPKQYLSRIEPSVGDWVVYLEPTKVPNSRGYFAVARLSEIKPDREQSGMYFAHIEPGSYIDFSNPVPFSTSHGPVERGVLNEQGRISGRAQAAVRPLSENDFTKIVGFGLADEEEILPRIEDAESASMVREYAVDFEYERPMIVSLSNRKKRDKLFRRAVLNAYDGCCAVSGWKLVNGGGRMEAEAAHIKPVSENGPDSVQNGIALSGTVHWMFDRGLIGLSDELDIIVHKKVNDKEGVESILNPTRKLIPPSRESHRPHPKFLEWHRLHHGF
jgi:putative restriction endonuclease